MHRSVEGKRRIKGPFRVASAGLPLLPRQEKEKLFFLLETIQATGKEENRGRPFSLLSSLTFYYEL